MSNDPMRLAQAFARQRPQAGGFGQQAPMQRMPMQPRAIGGLQPPAGMPPRPGQGTTQNPGGIMPPRPMGGLQAPPGLAPRPGQGGIMGAPQYAQQARVPGMQMQSFGRRGGGPTA